MPAKPQWMLQIPAMLTQLRALDVPVIDRSVCEKVFCVGRRRAVELMHRFGGYRSGNTVLIDRRDLIIQLETLEAGEEVKQERQRKVRLAETLDELQRYRAAAAVRIHVVPLRVNSLPEGIAFTPGRMLVEFSGVNDLISKLYGVAQSAAGDFDWFQATVECATRQPDGTMASALDFF